MRLDSCCSSRRSGEIPRISMREISSKSSRSRIGASAFSDCASLEAVEIPGSVETVGSGAFMMCEKLSEVTLGDGVETVDSSAFSYCTMLEEISLPVSVATVNKDAFSGCSSLTSVSIENVGANVDYTSFSGCNSITEIECSTDTIMINDVFYDSASGIQTIKITEGTEKIGSYSLAYLPALENLYIPKSVKSIELGALEGSEALANVTYSGAAVDWNAVEISDGNEMLSESNVECTGVHEHTWDEGTVTVEPTYTSGGTKVFTCTVCGESTESVIPRLRSTVRGDCDGDLSLTAGDVAALKEYLGGGSSDDVIAENCDVDNDGSVVAVDVALLKEILAS